MAVVTVLPRASARHHIDHMLLQKGLVFTHRPQIQVCSIYLRHMSTRTLEGLHNDNILLMYAPCLEHLLLVVFNLCLWSTPSHAQACARYHITCHFLVHALIQTILHCILLAGHREHADPLVLSGTSQCHKKYKSSIRSQGWVVPRWAYPFRNKSSLVTSQLQNLTFCLCLCFMSLYLPW